MTSKYSIHREKAHSGSPKPPVVKRAESLTDKQKLSKINSILLMHIGDRASLELAIRNVLRS